MDVEKAVKLNDEPLIKSVCEILKIRSVEEDPAPGKPFGEGVAQALEYALDLARSFGLRTRNLDNYIGWAEWGEGDEMVGILVHLDVVPEGGGWTYPPYGGEIHDGKIYGRGAVDNKGPAMAALYALKTLKDAGVKFKRRVRVIFGTNEESGMQCIKYYLEHDEAPTMGFSPDAEYPIINGEKGILTFSLKSDFENCCGIKQAGVRLISLKGGHRPNMVPDYAEAVLMGDAGYLEEKFRAFREKTGYDMEFSANGETVTVKSHGVSAHGSLPHRGKNAVMQLVAFLSELDLDNSRQQHFIRFLNDKIGLDTTGKGLGVDVADDVSGPLTFNVGIIRLDERAGEVVINIRYPIKYKGEELLNRIKENLAQGVRLEDVSDSPPHYVPEDSVIVRTLKAAYEKVTGEKAYCFSIGGGTYARMVKNAVAFGPGFPGKPELAHEKDEYIEIEDLLKNLRIYTNVLLELVT
ncbi:dipeptidase PepV [Thermosediminibacter litoriperuensis]|uniref:Succinyl-diaminopimelate desuccinylase n=1 Tax=Thermosediminibacter litoriperuensis TaxID=291989 RepID=A0A5S5AMQ8_9FIRM|nr:dipeptidase PepV [Thermosediminibacter litoriperuensis]TYP51311.1 succinyl-diaminopimelate desuccinylase [Thermosediminibacter litoriperuensis]